MKTTRQKFILAASISLAGLWFGETHSQAAVGTALVDNGGIQRLLNFDVTTPGSLTSSSTISGLTAGQTLVAIDYRPVDDRLYGLGYATATGAASIYTIHAGTGVATSINTLTLGTGLSRITIDFNPTANALRLVTSGATANNLRIPGGATGVLTTDTDLNPANAGIRATAYSRNNAGGGTSGATTLYEIDGTNNTLVRQGTIDFFTGSGTSPNTGTLTSVAGLVGVAGTNVAGFEIYNLPGTATTSAGTAYLATNTGSFLTLNLSNGTAGSVGTIGGAYTSILDMSVVPEPGSLTLLGLAGVGLAARRRRQVA